MSKWIAEFDLEDGDTMPEHMDLEYKGAKLDFHCRPMWTPVSEPPKKSGYYLVTIGFSNDKYIVVFRYYFADTQDWDDNHIIAWMPSPIPYKDCESE